MQHGYRLEIKDGDGNEDETIKELGKLQDELDDIVGNLRVERMKIDIDRKYDSITLTNGYKLLHIIEETKNRLDEVTKKITELHGSGKFDM